MKAIIKEYCKKFGYKFEKQINENEFITSKKTPVFAGMNRDSFGKSILDYKIKKIGYKTIYEKHLCFMDGDIIGNGYLNEL